MDDLTLALVLTMGAILAPASAYCLYMTVQLIREARR